MARSKLRSTPKRPMLRIEEILGWADQWFEGHGQWPNVNSGLIPGTLDDTWRRIDDSLRGGNRGLPRHSGLTLARLLERRRGVRNSEYPPKLSIPQIITWVHAYRRQIGEWPKDNSGPIPGADGESWLAVDMSLRKGRRGLPGGSSLARLLAAHCGVRNNGQVPPLTIATILRWADTYYALHEKRPTARAGKISETLGESWNGVDKALMRGRRGLPGGTSLAELLTVRRPRWASPRYGKRRPKPALT
jgi:hypothetical protein